MACVCVSERRKERGKDREKDVPAKPRPLHLTTSLFIRSIPPEVSKEEITAVRDNTHTLIFQTQINTLIPELTRLMYSCAAMSQVPRLPTGGTVRSSA